jgi:hypothetical protein
LILVTGNPPAPEVTAMFRTRARLTVKIGAYIPAGTAVAFEANSGEVTPMIVRADSSPLAWSDMGPAFFDMDGTEMIWVPLRTGGRAAVRLSDIRVKMF